MVQFSDWLKTQVHRSDGVGRLAREAVTDTAWPKDADFETCLKWLKVTARVHHINGLEDAWGNYSIVVLCTPPSTPVEVANKTG